MSHLLENREARPRPEPSQARILETLAILVMVALAVAMLYIGREIFIPIAIAIIGSFILSPPILLLRRLGLARVPSVVAVVLAALIVAFLVGAVLTRQVSDMAVNLPKYQATISAKLSVLRDAAADNALFAKIAATLGNLGDSNPYRPSSSDTSWDQRTGQQESERPIPVEVHQPAPGPFAIVQTIAGSALSPLETAFIVVVFIIFILLQREDLRNRFIRLAGSGDLQRTTMAMNDAAERLSRFFLAQTLLNASFGVIVGIGLYFIGLPSPVLWGIIAFVLRFVPYVGPVIAAGFPLALAAAIDPGWGMAFETLILFLVLEPIIGQVIEPWLYGHHTGISPIAVVVSATFWTWLWGPVGLVLSTPLTVCLDVLGRHVEHLEFLDIIFGDAPPLTPVEHFYQRMLVGDASEVAYQAERFLKTNSLIDYYDEVTLPALLMAQADLRRGVLDESRQKRIKDTIGEFIEDLSDHLDLSPASASKSGEAQNDEAPESPDHHPRSGTGGVEAVPLKMADEGFMPSQRTQNTILCIAGRSYLDEAAADLLAQLLVSNGIEAKVEAARALGGGQSPHLSKDDAVRIVCLSYLDADVSKAGARFAVRRLRRRMGGIKILGVFWQSDSANASELCTTTQADFCVTNFKDAVAFCIQNGAEKLEFKAETIAPQPAAKLLGTVES